MTKPKVAVIAPGDMGAAVGVRLAPSSAEGLTSLDGRSEASRQARGRAGTTMTDASDAEIAAADIVLSSRPAGRRQGVGGTLKPALRAANRKPVYVNCQRGQPDTVKSNRRQHRRGRLPLCRCRHNWWPAEPGLQ